MHSLSCPASLGKYLQLVVLSAVCSWTPQASVAQDHELEEIVVTSTRTRRSFEDIPTRYHGQQVLETGAKSSDYWIFGLMTEKSFNDDFSVFLNFENFSDTPQTRDGPIYSDSLADPEFVDIYAPLDGFVINGVEKIRI